MQEPRLNAAKILIADQERRNLSHHPAKKRRGTFLFPEPTGPHPQRRKNHDSSSASSCVTTTKEFTYEELQRLLFNKNEIQEISVKRPLESRQNECFCEYIITDRDIKIPKLVFTGDREWDTQMREHLKFNGKVKKHTWFGNKMFKRISGFRKPFWNMWISCLFVLTDWNYG